MSLELGVVRYWELYVSHLVKAGQTDLAVMLEHGMPRLFEHAVKQLPLAQRHKDFVVKAAQAQLLELGESRSPTQERVVAEAAAELRMHVEALTHLHLEVAARLRSLTPELLRLGQLALQAQADVHRPQMLPRAPCL